MSIFFINQDVPLDMKGCICHFIKWQIHPFISKGTTICFSYLKLGIALSISASVGRKRGILSSNFYTINASRGCLLDFHVLCVIGYIDKKSGGVFGTLFSRFLVT